MSDKNDATGIKNGIGCLFVAIAIVLLLQAPLLINRLFPPKICPHCGKEIK
jgi:hypothetical protein